ncbi:MAG: hypothetical protein HGA94_04795, partial [Candidatus Aminicenantes bacterium]|nr:hypothetical protein [Candidatus Aminicenantes bacterium]
MRKPICLAVLILAFAGFALTAPAAVKVVKSPADLPAPFAGIAREGDIFVTDGRFAAVIAATSRPLWSTINYGHPDVAGCVAAFLPAGASARPEAQVGYPYIRLDGKALIVTTSSVRPEGEAVVARASAQAPDGSRLDILVRYTFSFESGRIDVAAEVRNSGKAEVKGLSVSLGASAWQSYNFSPYNAKSFPSLNFRVYERPDHALAWHNPNPVETSEKPLPGALRPGQVHRLSYSIFTAAAVPDVLDRLYRAAHLQPVRATLEKERDALLPRFLEILGRDDTSLPLPRRGVCAPSNVQDAIRQELVDDKVRVHQICPAGEKGVRFANIVNDLKHFNGRGGLGAVMGAKNLRAIAVRGTAKPDFADPAKLLALARAGAEKVARDGTWKNFKALGTLQTVTDNQLIGGLPTRNWTMGTFERYEEIGAEAFA